MDISRSSAVCLAVACIIGCSDPPPPKKTVFDPLTQQQGRAKDVQNTVDQNTDRTRRAVDGQERGDAPERADGQDHADGQDRGDSRP
jgi:hypothetical protein